MACALDPCSSYGCASVASTGWCDRHKVKHILAFIDQRLLEDAMHHCIVNVDLGHRHLLPLDYLFLALDDALQVFDVLLSLHPRRLSPRHLHGAQDDEYQYGPVSVN